MAGRGGSHPVKVKIIMTQFVQTDAQSFKSVVQRLTGRDTSIAPAAAAMTAPPRLGESFGDGGKKVLIRPKEEISFGEGHDQLEEMERMFLDLPSFDEFLSFGVE
ncbi:hypothetical protein MRB53_026674 [Persea americana]|uniref:Uncharacterized protein n=1 Tax=Persea americana TaxID=3435 RepID=A0ACC2LJ10_PERAE|nr:hypothetical protein MRB53_026674 [Persea americana]|eukprot:TRINITY_DN69745_c0_g1_i1.p1 TRINITY_DN69745_c0_g1~~TRINITY_DN69745_c0_g1_i1.p1  ORF type:complete len:105 (-),score=29.86 TRINITY_DN69745_c0_g1_i1:49-363(-)